MKRTLILTALLGLTAGLVSAQERTVATVNGVKITSTDVTKKLWWQYSSQGLSDLIDEKLMLQDASRLKVAVDSKEADKRYEALSAGFKGKGEFESSLKAVGWTPSEVKELIKRQLLIKNTVLAAKEITVTDENVATFFEQN